MVAKFYLGTPYDHPQENEAFHRLCCTTEKLMGSREDVRVIGNVACNGCQMDALVLRHSSIIIIDFKDYGGAITVSAYDKWNTAKELK